MNVSKKASKRVLCPEGSHMAIVTQILDRGTQPGANGPWRMMEIGFETPEETHVFNEERGEEPFVVFQTFSDNLGGNKKRTNLRNMVEGVLGKAVGETFDLEELMGKVCQIQLVHEEKGEYTNEKITSYMAPLKGFKNKFKVQGIQVILDLNNFDEEAFALLPEWKQDLIKKTDEYKALSPSAKKAPAPTSTAKAGKTGKSKTLFN